MNLVIFTADTLALTAAEQSGIDWEAIGKRFQQQLPLIGLFTVLLIVFVAAMRNMLAA